MPSIDDAPEQAPDIYRGRFESCFREHHARLLAFTMRRLSGREAAEDVVADTFAVAWRRRDCIPDGPLPWLYAIATNVIADQYRSTRRRHDLGSRLAHEARAEVPGSDPAESLALREAFSTVFAQLEEREREVLRLIAWDGLEVRHPEGRSPAHRQARPGGCPSPRPPPRRGRLLNLAWRPTASFASIGSPEKGGGPNLIHMLNGTLEVQGR